MKHLIPSNWRKKQILVDLAGCGGTGSQLFAKLARLHLALLHDGHPHGLQVTVYDPDIITPANVGRTIFSPSDVGQAKVAVMVSRVNAFHGLHWEGFCLKYDSTRWRVDRDGAPADLVITSTDSLRSRAEIYRGMLFGELPPPRYWLDCGNDRDTGQVVLGEPEWIGDPLRPRLRTVVDLFPDMLNRAETEEEEPESCTLAAALDRQSLYINDAVAEAGANLLYRLFRDGGLEWHGKFINQATGRDNPIPVEQPSADAVARRLAALQASLAAPEEDAVPV